MAFFKELPADKAFETEFGDRHEDLLKVLRVASERIDVIRKQVDGFESELNDAKLAIQTQRNLTYQEIQSELSSARIKVETAQNAADLALTAANNALAAANSVSFQRQGIQNDISAANADSSQVTAYVVLTDERIDEATSNIAGASSLNSQTSEVATSNSDNLFFQANALDWLYATYNANH
jgi:hypothetical protein